MSRVYNNASLWLTTIAAGSSTAFATMSICNRDVRSIICLNPSISSHAINFCVTSYADEIRLAVTVDPNLIPDPQFFTECFNQQVKDFFWYYFLILLYYLVKCCSRTSCTSSNSW